MKGKPMEKKRDILKGFEEYTTAAELSDTNAMDAPATSAPCVASTIVLTSRVDC
ncbi:hypothetical protein [Nocardia sp. CA-290969]|uniref:hypothetical protein n=1 Tax=Nocardia sp. CA-290969 TaxID=3239986 RepID=UPI003D942958